MGLAAVSRKAVQGTGELFCQSSLRFYSSCFIAQAVSAPEQIDELETLYPIGTAHRVVIDSIDDHKRICLLSLADAGP